MTRPSLSEHAKEIALLKQAREHDAAHDMAVLDALEGIRTEMKTLREHVDSKFELADQKYTALDKAVAEAKAMVRGFGAGWAAAFMFIGGAIGVGISNLTGLFK